MSGEWDILEAVEEIHDCGEGGGKRWKEGSDKEAEGKKEGGCGGGGGKIIKKKFVK